MSKIEITLSSDFYTADQLNAMEVSLCNVLPTVDLSLADGTTNAAHGTRITVKPLKPSASSPTFEAVIPAQARPDNFIVVRLDGGVVNVDAQVSEFDANTRYPYNLDITYRDVRKNPLWYVAEYNVNYDGSSTYSWATTPDEGYYFSWADAMKAFTTAANASAASPTGINEYYLGTGSKFAGWHLPTMKEYLSIVPGLKKDGSASNGSDIVNIYKIDLDGDNIRGGTACDALTTAIWGYDQTTMTGVDDDSYWVLKTKDCEVHALRFLGTDYCSAWKYLKTPSGMYYTICATLIGKVDKADAAEWYANHFDDVYFGNNESLGAVQRTFGRLGYRTAGGGANASGSTANNTETEPYGTYFSATTGIRMWCGSWGSHVNSFTSTFGCTIRLFKDNLMNIISLSEATADDIGKVVCSNAHVHEKVSDVTCGGVASGMIAYISSKGHGLVIALTGCNNTGAESSGVFVWSSANTGCNSYSRARPTSYDGISAWRLPSQTDWNNMLGANGCLNFNNLKTMKGRQSSTCGASVFRDDASYWSSTKYGSTTAYYFLTTSGTWNYMQSTNSACARPCFTF